VHNHLKRSTSNVKDKKEKKVHNDIAGEAYASKSM